MCKYNMYKVFLALSICMIGEKRNVKLLSTVITTVDKVSYFICK